MKGTTIELSHKHIMDAAFRLRERGEISEEQYQTMEDRYRKLQ